MEKNKSLLIPIVEVLSKGVSFINLLLFVHILSVDDYADYSYIVAIVMWSSVLMDGGINSLIYNNSLKGTTHGINRLYTSRFILSLFIIGLLGLFFLYRKPLLTVSAILFSLTTYFSTTSALVKMLSRGLNFFKVDFICIITEPLIRFLFLILIYFISSLYNFNLNTVLLVYLIAGLISFLINKHFLKAVFLLKLTLKNIRQVYTDIVFSINQSKFYLLYYLILVGIGRIDILFLEANVNKHNLAIFSSAINIYQVAQLFFLSVITSQFTRLYNDRSVLYKILLPLLILSIVTVNLLSSFVFELLFPVEYINGQFVLNIIILSLLPAVVNYYFITRNNYENKVKTNFILLFLALIIKIILYTLLKPTDLAVYSYIFVGIEAIIFVCFIIKKGYESITS